MIILKISPHATDMDSLPKKTKNIPHLELSKPLCHLGSMINSSMELINMFIVLEPTSFTSYNEVDKARTFGSNIHEFVSHSKN